MQLSYAIGVAEPLSIYVDTYGTGKKTDEELVAIIRNNWDLRPGVIGMFYKPPGVPDYLLKLGLQLRNWIFKSPSILRQRRMAISVGLKFFFFYIVLTPHSQATLLTTGKNPSNLSFEAPYSIS